MTAYLVKRLLATIPTIVLVSIIAFLMLRIIPGDPAAARLEGPTGTADYTEEDLKLIRAKLGTDRPLIVQYGDWAFSLLKGDLGKSLLDDTSINQTMAHRLPLTLELAIVSLVFSTVLAIPLGVISAVNQNTWIDYVGRLIAITGVTVPLFVVAIMIVFIVVRYFEWLPPIGYKHIWEEPLTNLKQLMFPIIALSFTRIGYTARITRSSMLEVLREDYVRTARSKGLGTRAVVYRHALQNAILPVFTLASFQFSVLVGGTVIIEEIFQLPGVGRLLLTSITTRDYNIVQAVVMTTIGIILMVNLIVDLLYPVVDPRIRYR